MNEIEKNNITNLLNNVSLISKKYEDLAEYTGENFNVFNILGIYSSELSHSSFIANLLNVKGKHGQKDVFLELFIEEFNEMFEENSLQRNIIKNFNLISSKSVVEHYAGKVNYENGEGGFIDILINDGEKKIIIENKIWAVDQPKQLLRYNQFDKNAPIIYLTLNGKLPSENSKGELELGKEFICLSYETNIVNWIEKCIKEMANKPIIRETLNQYLILVKQITDQSNNQNMTNELINQIISNKQNLISYQELLNSQNSIKKELFNSIFFKDIIEKIGNTLNLELVIDEGIYYGKIYAGFSLFNSNLTQKNICIRFDFQGNNFQSPLFGLMYIDKTKINSDESEKVKINFEKIFGRAFGNGNFAAYIVNSKWTERFNNIGSWESLINLKFENENEEIYNDMNFMISKMIEIFENHYKL